MTGGPLTLKQTLKNAGQTNAPIEHETSKFIPDDNGKAGGLCIRKGVNLNVPVVALISSLTWAVDQGQLCHLWASPERSRCIEKSISTSQVYNLSRKENKMREVTGESVEVCSLMAPLWHVTYKSKIPSCGS